MTDNIICQLSHWKNKEEFDKIRNEKGDYSLEGFDRLNCIFIHIPKSAGISISIALFDNYGGGHKTVRTYKKIFGPILYKRYFTFTFVRNPYSRLLSAYKFLKGGGFNENDRNWANENLSEYDSFDEFVRKWLDKKEIWTYTHFKPQYSFVCDVGLEPEVDFIGRFESIEEDFNKVCKILNINRNLPVYNRSQADTSNWKQYYSSYALEKVADIYHRDFTIFNYSKL